MDVPFYSIGYGCGFGDVFIEFVSLGKIYRSKIFDLKNRRAALANKQE